MTSLIYPDPTSNIFLELRRYLTPQRYGAHSPLTTPFNSNHFCSVSAEAVGVHSLGAFAPSYSTLQEVNIAR
ncbi:hypothetical protein QCA50_010700 [Cerrena zonata]|uniref:Uncharacterized protein n=1 Tax=Cerrena zonata TaxID=2478898 RepID=A0AAW0G7E2_9APHY